MNQEIPDVHNGFQRGRGTSDQISSISFPSFRSLITVGFIYMTFIVLRYVPFMSDFWRFFFFIINGCWILSKSFSASVEIIIWLLIIQFVNKMNHIDWFANIKESLHPWNKAHLAMMYDLLNMLLDSVSKNFVEDFCIYVHQWYWPVVLVFCGIFVSFW